MLPKIISIDETTSYDRVGERAADVLKRGGVVVFPTETVYGVGARADLPGAVERLRRLKGRSDGKPFTIHIPDRRCAESYVPSLAGPGRRLVEKGWPGPLTLLFQVPNPSSAPVLAGRNGTLAREIYYEGQVGLRCPDHALAERILAGADGPVVAASANRAGFPAPRTAEEALVELGGEVDLVVDGGRSQFAQASTIVKLTGRDYEIVREGVYDARTVRRLACMNLLFVCSGNTCRSPMAAGLCEQMVSRRLGCEVSELGQHDVVVRSAGTFAQLGGRAAEEAVEVMQRRGVDISRHTTHPLTPELIHQADRIYAMTPGHQDTILAMAPSCSAKITVLGGERGIDDPIGQGMEVYEACAVALEEALRRHLSEVEL